MATQYRYQNKKKLPNTFTRKKTVERNNQVPISMQLFSLHNLPIYGTYKTFV